MLNNKPTLKKITMATGVVAMSVGLISAFSYQTQAMNTTGNGYVFKLITCYDANGVQIGQGNTCSAADGGCTPNFCN